LSNTENTKKTGPSIKKINSWLFGANVEALGPGIEDVLKKHAEKPIATDDDIQIKGLVNPIYLVIVGFSTPKIIEAVRRESKKIYNILVIEPDMGIFHQTIKRYNCLDIFKDTSRPMHLCYISYTLFLCVYKCPGYIQSDISAIQE